ncbi:isochorismatase family protein [Candidatus Woesearchaeota archaeon]|nr:isochorismatase family protein [Candidatus Woesearchaeota archaeon]
MINTSNLGLVIVDMQESFLKKIPEDEVQRLVKKQRRVLEVAVEMDIPVGVLEYGCGRTIKRIKEIVDRAARHRYFEKTLADGFEPKNIISEVKPQDWFKERKVKRLLLSGIYATDCVASTGLGARRAGFEVLVSTPLVNQNETPEFGFEKYYYFLGFEMVSYKRLVRR